MPERDMMKASAQIELGHRDDAVQSLAELAEDSEAEPALRAAARARSIELRTGPEGNYERLAEALALVESEPDIVIYHVVASWMYEKLKDRESALEQAHAASKLLGKAATVNDQIMVADLLVDLNETDDAVEIYTLLAPDPVDSKFGRQLLKALFVSDRRTSLPFHASVRTTIQITVPTLAKSAQVFGPEYRSALRQTATAMTTL